jgi:hypothetical protein
MLKQLLTTAIVLCSVSCAKRQVNLRAALAPMEAASPW